MVFFLKRPVLIILVFLIVACSTQEKKPLVTDITRQKQLKVERLLAEHHYNEALDLLKTLETDFTLDQNSIRLNKAFALFNLAYLNEAKQELDGLNLETLTIAQRDRSNLLYSQIFLKKTDGQQALNFLHVIDASKLKLDDRRLYHELAILGYSLTSQLIESVHERIALDSYLPEGERKEENKHAILNVLVSLPPQALKTNAIFKKIGVYSGWVELAAIERSMRRGSADFNMALAYWSEQYINHPGQSLIAADYFNQDNRAVSVTLGVVDDVAIFLPESGGYAPYAQAIKAGFKAAYYQDTNRGNRPNIRFYDTESMPIADLYEQAITDGVQLVIGPLNKQLIKTLTAETHLSVPVLALNYVEDIAVNNLYQFALSPIDDVEQAVKHAYQQGFKKALIIAPTSIDGRRIEHYFQVAWQQIGGEILAIEHFKPGIKDFSLPIKKILNINQSEARYERLKKMLGKLDYNSRSRQDIDVIFMVATYQEARLINPQFYHHRAGTVPVYGLSGLYDGHENIAQHVDLNGMRFCSIPWLFSGAYQGNLSRQILENLERQFPQRLNLIAFGLDAYNLIPYLNQLSSVSYRGATGQLSLDPHYRIVRGLECAQFTAGKVNLIPDEDNALLYPTLER